ncbi:MAG: endonuclease [Candidatus Phlomobacter fragariae]
MTDSVFRVMEANLYNIALSIGEVNGYRSNFNYANCHPQFIFPYGQCQSRVDFKNRIFEPKMK